jgi:hypothetical protein
LKKRLLVAMTGLSLLLTVAAAPALAANGGVDRYQVGTTTYTVAVLDTYIHTFVVTANPCDGSIAVTGSTAVDSGYYTTETVTGTLTAGVISFSAVYDGPYNPGFAWAGSFPVAGGALSGDFTGTVTAAPATFTTYRNHGDYVSAMGGGADAAHSCIGMPVKADGAATGESDATKSADATARLIANLQRVITRLEADGHASATASAAIQRHVDALTTATAGNGREAASAKPSKADKAAGTPGKAKKPAAAAKGKAHPAPRSHSGKP